MIFENKSPTAPQSQDHQDLAYFRHFLRGRYQTCGNPPKCLIY